MGFVADGATRLDITSTTTGPVTGQTAQTSADITAQGVHASLVDSAQFSATALTTTTDFGLTIGGALVRLAGTTTIDSVSVSGSLDATVDGQPFATITFGPNGPSYSAASGVQLTSADEQEILLLWLMSDVLFFDVTSLTTPALVFKM